MTLQRSAHSRLSHFLVIGSNFTKADTQTRSRFAVTDSCRSEVYEKIKRCGIKEFFVLSTCNRTEFYGCATEEQLKKIVFDQLSLQNGEYESYFYVKAGFDAIRHLLRVAAGLDSQIIGDYEIVGQLKLSVKSARENGLIGTLTDRVTSLALQASKQIKGETELSSGRYSVSAAATEIISVHFKQKPDLKILVIGTGKFGITLSRNLKDYLPSARLTLTNRTASNAESHAKELNAQVLPYDTFTHYLNDFDVVIATAQSDQFLIRAEHIEKINDGFFLDLGIPSLIDPVIRNFTNVRLFSVDDVSIFHNKVIEQRLQEIPKVERLLEESMLEFMQWQNVYFRSDVINIYRSHTHQLLQGQTYDSRLLDKKFSSLIKRIRENGFHGCQVIQTMNEVIAVEN
jgi:glutamyl-tRNA reductase